MRRTYQVLAYVLVAEVIVQAMAIATALAGLGKWIDDGHTLTKAVQESHPRFAGALGFPIHAINGEMLIPLIVLALLAVSFFAKVADGTRRALILVALIAVQVALGIALQGVPYVALLHVLNAFAILAVAWRTAQSAAVPGSAQDSSARSRVSV
ncbi:MAG: hypothetical protein NVS3B26_04410 [Mycobacteriales bacterium]